MKSLVTTLTAVGFVIVANAIFIPLSLAALTYLVITAPKKPRTKQKPA